MLASPILQTPSPVRVAGDSVSGFYRREYQDNRPWDRVEAFSWGGLTSGGALRALWLLLTPFLLANVAFWASPVPLGERASERQVGDPGHRWILRWASGVVQRLFALSLTATFVVGIVTAAMDVVGWQYVRTFFKRGHEVQSSLGRVGWLSFLDWSWLAHPNLQLLATALAPLAGVLLLWALGYQSWRRLEAVNGSYVAPADPTTFIPLEDRRMWNGLGPVARLRAVHVAFGLAIVGLSMLAPLLLSSQLGSAQVDLTATPWGIATLVDGGALGVLIVLSVILVTLPSMSHRPPLAHEGKSPPPTPWFYRCLPWVSLGLTVAAGVILVGFGNAFPSASTSLPGIVDAIEGLFLAQAFLLFVLAVVTFFLRSAIPRDDATDVPPVSGGTAANSQPVWFGLTPVVLSTMGWLLAGSWSAALTMGAVKTTGGNILSSAIQHPRVANPIIVPAPFIWAAAATLVVVLAGLVIVMGTGIYARVVKRSLRSGIERAYAGEFKPPIDDALNRPRFRYIRLNWLVGRAPDFVAGPVGVFTLMMWGVIIGGIILYFRDDAAISNGHRALLYQLGSVVIIGIGALSLVAARLAFSDQDDRRRIGVLWDVGTFWPRATHPLAPPCYAERAVPDLLERTEYYRGHVGSQPVGPPGGLPVVLSCHSQGSIIGAAVILQLSYSDSANVRFLTYGSPLRRLYARYFPAYFGAKTLCRVGTLLSAEGVAGSVPVTATAAARQTWRWRNLWRPTDPVGHPVFVDYAAFGAQSDVDEKLRDPLQFGNVPGDPSAPGANDHSNYPLDPAYDEALGTLLEFRP
jgi:hypothetical protein